MSVCSFFYVMFLDEEDTLLHHKCNGDSLAMSATVLSMGPYYYFMRAIDSKERDQSRKVVFL